MTTIDDLPVEILRIILNEVPRAYLVSITRVCRLWRRAIPTDLNVLTTFYDLVNEKDANILAWFIGCDRKETKKFLEELSLAYSDRIIENTLARPGVLKSCPIMIAWINYFFIDCYWNSVLFDIAMREDEVGIKILGNLLRGGCSEAFNNIEDCSNYIKVATLLLEAGFEPRSVDLCRLIRTNEGQKLLSQHYCLLQADVLDVVVRHLFTWHVMCPKLEDIEWIREIIGIIDVLGIIHLMFEYRPQFIEWFCDILGWDFKYYLEDIATEMLKGRYDSYIGNKNYTDYGGDFRYVDKYSIYVKIGDIIGWYYCNLTTSDDGGYRIGLIEIIKKIDNGELFQYLRRVLDEDFGNIHEGIF